MSKTQGQTSQRSFRQSTAVNRNKKLLKNGSKPGSKKKTVNSTAQSSVGPVDTELQRIDKIRDNLKLLNQIMEIEPQQQNRSHSIGGVYLPLPNHNYVPSGSQNLKAAPAKAKHYQIRALKSKFPIKEPPKLAKTVLRESLAYTGHQTQSIEDLQKKLSINKQSVGQMMQSDYSKMTRAQESLIRHTSTSQTLVTGTFEGDSDYECRPQEIIFQELTVGIAVGPQSSARSLESDEMVIMKPVPPETCGTTTGS